MTKHGWHFLPADGCVPRLGTRVVVGLIERYEGPLVLCQSGLHFSERPLDSLIYAPGPILQEVNVSGSIVMDTDKGVATIRETLWVDDVTAVLRAFARWCAWTVRDKWIAPKIVLDYLAYGREEDRDATRDAAWAATRDATRDAAWAAWAAWAARAAARAATRDAAWAAWAAAWAAARAARAAARAATRDAQNEKLIAMIYEFRSGKREWIFSA